jgi:hypothetical protein
MHASPRCIYIKVRLLIPYPTRELRVLTEGKWPVMPQ